MPETHTVCIILIPKQYNPDRRKQRRPIERTKLHTTGTELAKRFGGATILDGDSAGYWREAGLIYEDRHWLVQVDIDGSRTQKRALKEYISRVLLSRFRQKAIHGYFISPITSFDVMRFAIDGLDK